MVNLLFGIVRDLYVVLLIILLFEQIPGSDLLHDLTRKGVITVTVCVIVVKLAQQLAGTSVAGPVRAPRRQKKTEGGKSATLEWASSEMQGWRPAMEDATCAVASLPSPLSDQAMFAVFDGHGGAQVSAIVSREFPKMLSACTAKLSSANEADAHPEEVAPRGGGDTEHPAEPTSLLGKSLHLAMMTMDAFLQKGADRRNSFSLVGSTAIVVVIDCGNGARPRSLTVANCGDSRAVLCREGRALELSEDHKPELPGEERRIRRAGGHVAQNGACHRIDGCGLNLSRALGDFHYKAASNLPPEEQKVIAVPEIRTLDLVEGDEFVVLGCDGVFELHSSQNAVDIVRQGLGAGMSVEEAAEDLVDKSCSSNLMKTRGKGGDNCSAVVVRIK
mmetsp:Transcript_120663/g.341848  ORF Transcript_120663/g.341848 Transcript_120663/m.341848 type:complete len:389 (+) Transcript_120663:128-1294(+)